MTQGQVFVGRGKYCLNQCTAILGFYVPGSKTAAGTVNRAVWVKKMSENICSQSCCVKGKAWQQETYVDFLGDFPDLGVGSPLQNQFRLQPYYRLRVGIEPSLSHDCFNLRWLVIHM